MIQEHFSEILSIGGKTNSLGRSAEVLTSVLEDESKLHELYKCLFDEDAWVRMRAADTLEKVCRVNPQWIEEYIDRIIADLSRSSQPSIQWHLAQIYRQVNLTDTQKKPVIHWLENLLSTIDVDWIVAANVMDTLAQFTNNDLYSKDKMITLLKIQLTHRSKSVIKRAEKLLASFEP